MEIGPQHCPWSLQAIGFVTVSGPRCPAGDQPITPLRVGALRPTNAVLFAEWAACTRRIAPRRSPTSTRVLGFSSWPARHAGFSQPPPVFTMSAQAQRPTRRDGALSSLNAAIEAMNIVKDALSITPAKAVVGSVSIILTLIRVGFLPLSSTLIDRGLIQTGFHDQQN